MQNAVADGKSERLGGPQTTKLTPQERLEKLQNSAAYGGADVLQAVQTSEVRVANRDNNVIRNTAVPRQGSKPPPPRSTAHRESAPAQCIRKASSTVRTMTARNTGSRLHETTAAYRANRGTTARTVETVGRDTMTQEKRAQVDKAREKVLGAKSGGSRMPQTRSSSCNATSSRRAAAADRATKNGGGKTISNGLGPRANVHTLNAGPPTSESTTRVPHPASGSGVGISGARKPALRGASDVPRGSPNPLNPTLREPPARRRA